MRQLIGSAKLRPDQENTQDMLIRTYSTAMSEAAAAVLDLWVAGKPPPTPEGHLEPVQLIHQGDVVGFNVYLVWGEVRRLGGKMESEPV